MELFDNTYICGLTGLRNFTLDIKFRSSSYRMYWDDDTLAMSNYTNCYVLNKLR